MTSEAKNDGGPAFPHPVAVGPSGDVYSSDDVCTRGLSMRDWFAGMQMARIGSGWPNEENMRKLANDCYAMADAMLDARSK